MASPTTQTANAIAAIRNKSSIPVPEIDFTQHTLENGETVSTTERVVKDVSVTCALSPPVGRAGYASHLVSLGCGVHMLTLQVQAPAMYLPSDEQFWSDQDKTKPDIAFLKNHFYREGRLTEEQALYILQK